MEQRRGKTTDEDDVLVEGHLEQKTDLIDKTEAGNTARKSLQACYGKPIREPDGESQTTRDRVNEQTIELDRRSPRMPVAAKCTPAHRVQCSTAVK